MKTEMYQIISKEDATKFYKATDKFSQLSYTWANSATDGDKFTFAEGNKLLEQLNKVTIIAGLVKYIDVSDLNGTGATDLKLITETIQEPDPFKFSERCQILLHSQMDEVIVHYSVNAVPWPTPQGIIIMFIATMQYYGTAEREIELKDALRRSNLLIKP